MKLENVSRTVPVNTLDARFTYSSADNRPNSNGSDPTRLLSARFRVVSASKFPTSPDKVPVRKFNSSDNDSSSVFSHNSSGIGPVNRLSPTWNVVIEDAPISVGMAPASRLMSSIKVSKFGSVNSRVGMVPVSLLSVSYK